MDPRLLFDGAHLRVTQQGQGRLWATFDNFDAARRGFDPLRLSATAAGFAQVHVQTAANDWYLNPDLDAALQIPPGQGRALGISMGAFGALLFARALGTGELILVSPASPRPWAGPGAPRSMRRTLPRAGRRGWKRRPKPCPAA